MTVIPVTLAIGLVVGVGYVGNRILAPRAHATTIFVAKPAPVAHAPSIPQVAQPVGTAAVAPAPAVPPAPVAAPATVSQAVAQPPVVAHAKEPQPFVEVKTALPASPPEGAETGSGPAADVDKDLGLIAPRPGERYLQIAAIASNMVPSFLADLKKYNVQASVAPGPHDGLVRIVIGPFANRDSAARAKDQIQIKWTDCFVRLY
ncbi:MAG TPA: SPOR domain-containing protein [Bryobacteraceae bacterium]|nr:SPOR domain-containing protein [Bryobacteraceae bacterium]